MLAYGRTRAFSSDPRVIPNFLFDSSKASKLLLNAVSGSDRLRGQVQLIPARTAGWIGPSQEFHTGTGRRPAMARRDESPPPAVPIRWRFSVFADATTSEIVCPLFAFGPAQNRERGLARPAWPTGAAVGSQSDRASGRWQPEEKQRAAEPLAAKVRSIPSFCATAERRLGTQLNVETVQKEVAVKLGYVKSSTSTC